LRRLIVDNIRVNTVYGRLITEDGEGNGRVLYDEINRWTEEARQDPDIWKPIGQVLDQERYDHPMGYAKVVHEFAWSEVEGLVLRHLQVIFFKESTRPGEDWAEIFREACEMLVTELYRRAIEDAPSENGFPHPLIVAFCNDELSEYAEKMIAEV
jgi:hypothetical protein